MSRFDGIPESKKEEIQKAVEDSVRASMRGEVHFGWDYTPEEKLYAVMVGKNFGVHIKDFGKGPVAVPGGRNKNVAVDGSGLLVQQGR